MFIPTAVRIAYTIQIDAIIYIIYLNIFTIACDSFPRTKNIIAYTIAVLTESTENTKSTKDDTAYFNIFHTYLPYSATELTAETEYETALDTDETVPDVAVAPFLFSLSTDIFGDIDRCIKPIFTAAKNIVATTHIAKSMIIPVPLRIF